jgi:hypothetical protein
MMFSRIPPKQCTSRWLWGVLVIFFFPGSILIHCGNFHFDFFVECVLSNHISFALPLHLLDCPVFSHSSSLDIICGHLCLFSSSGQNVLYFLSIAKRSKFIWIFVNFPIIFYKSRTFAILFVEHNERHHGKFPMKIPIKISTKKCLMIL